MSQSSSIKIPSKVFNIRLNGSVIPSAYSTADEQDPIERFFDSQERRDKNSSKGKRNSPERKGMKRNEKLLWQYANGCGDRI